MEKPAFDPNAYCSGHITGHGDHPNIAAFPDNFVAEALALGAELDRTPNGFVTVAPLFKDRGSDQGSDPRSLADLPALDEQEPALRVLSQIQNSPPEKIRLLKANGPYSILASLVDPPLLYRWLSKNPAEMRRGLEKITAGLGAYILKAFDRGVSILSLADPFANPRVLGERRCREFAGSYLAELLRLVMGAGHRGRVIHLCPHNSIALEKSGLLRSETFPMETDPDGGESYLDGLLKAGNPDGATLLGHQCIYTKNAREFIRLVL
jgi:uroporphyrinogen-III decarboxylase